MVDQERFLDALAGFARTLAHGYEIAEVLNDLTGRIVNVIGLLGAGVSVLERDRLRFVTSDSERVGFLEQTQERHQQGACVDAVRTGQVVAVSDLRPLATEWPAFVEQAAAIGVVSVAAIPLRDGETIGALDLYDGVRREWSDDDISVASMLADIAASYVINASKLDQQRRTNEQLARALESRIIIEQAKGIISAHRGVTIDEAFGLLRKHARDNNANLHAVADAVVHLGLRP